MTRRPLVAGILSIGPGALCAFLSVYVVFGLHFIGAIKEDYASILGSVYPPEMVILFTSFLTIYMLFTLIIGILAISGGIFTLKRKCWPIALAGAIGTTIIFFPFFFPFGIAAIILVSLAKNEFSAIRRLST